MDASFVRGCYVLGGFFFFFLICLFGDHRGAGVFPALFLPMNPKKPWCVKKIANKDSTQYDLGLS